MLFLAAAVLLPLVLSAAAGEPSSAPAETAARPVEPATATGETAPPPGAEAEASGPAPAEAAAQQPAAAPIVPDLAAALEEVLPESPKRLGDSLPAWVRYEFLGVAIWQFIAAFLLVLLGLVLRKVSDYVFEKRIIPTLQKTRFDIDHLLTGALAKPLGCVILLAALALAVWVLALPTEPTNVRAGAFGAR